MILFLDFDGVLHPDGALEPDHFCCLPLFEAWLAQRHDVRLVISSTWRFDGPLRSVIRPFSPAVRERFLGSTGGYMQENRGWIRSEASMLAAGWPTTHKRHCEILDWLETHAWAGQRWAALDDVAANFAPGTPELVLCDSRVGLGMVQLEQLDVLRGRPAA